ncbi:MULTISPECIES: cyclic nucleotide-binding domain-containing protein [Nostoc]|uniref:Cyclic nucleotide-binding domain-containing protein n=1 Tax=Nostoc paludosum FACHB-159 TaxID=2692908 RepID=A0ABR8KG31_9NOSO|nr:MULTISPECIES: cyclic nucleotide-binding domain-containing protein [Nostoc]MBD2680628.1 cyclic nucleotide-binding domain-containing protein [Nostoc sp. FACHB-857]MBD2737022.1 cyclic nucleotide-binding domain-containing protein [Nostoc paludosum FACHB-159]
MFREILFKNPLFACFKESDINWMFSIGKCIEYSTNEIIIQEGQGIIDTVAILLEGALSICVSPTGNVKDLQQIDRVSLGEIVEALSFVDNRPPSSTVIALEPSQVLTLPKQLLLKKLEQDTEFAAHFYQTLSVLMSQQLRRLTDFLVKNKVVPGEALRKVLFVFAILNDGDIDWIISQGIKTKVNPGKVLIEAGKPVEALYILLDGKLGIFVTTPHNETAEKEIAQSIKGEILGEMSFVEATTASATVKAAESSVLLALPQQKLAGKLKQDPGFTARFYRAIAVVLVDRIRDRLFRRGFGTLAYQLDQLLAEDIEVEDELNLDTLDNTALAGARFDWMIKRFNRKS